jgi:hypothetical protein
MKVGGWWLVVGGWWSVVFNDEAWGLDSGFDFKLLL